MPQLIAPFLVPIFGATVGTVLAYVGYTVVTMVALRALTPRPDAGAFAAQRGTLVTQRASLDAHEIVYGRVRKGGPITYIETTGPDNQVLHMIITLAAHECDAVEDIYFNDELVQLDAQRYVITPPWNDYYVRVIAVLGQSGQMPPPPFLAETQQVDGNFRGEGICYLYVRMVYDPERFASGVPLITAVVRGKKVYDPRTGVTAWSRNAALCIRDYLTDQAGLGDPSVDDNVFATAADDCDGPEPINTLTYYATWRVLRGWSQSEETRAAIDGIVRTSEPIGDTLERMVQACGGTLWWSGGSWKLKAGVYTATVKTLTAADLRSGIEVDTKASMRDQFNRVTGTFANAVDRWLPTSYPEVTSPVFLAEDGGVDSAAQLDLPFTTSPARAQRLALQALRRSREQITVSAEWGIAALDLTIGDTVALTLPDYGWTGKTFEVAGWGFGPSSAGDLRVRMVLRETSAAAYGWVGDDRDIIANNTNLPDPRNPGTAAISLSSELRIINEQVSGVLMADVSVASPFASAAEVQYRQSGASEWIALGTAPPGRFEATGISDGQFDVRARAVGWAGVRGAWTTISGWGVVLFAPAPANVTNLSANVAGATLHLSWTPVADLDLSHYRLRWSPFTSGAIYGNAIDLIERVPRPATSASVPARPGTYFVKAVDKLGTASAASASVVVVTDMTALENLNLIQTLTEHPAFTGARSDVVVMTDVTGPYLTLDTDPDWDAMPGNWDDALGLWDGANGGVVPSGTYEFAQLVDLGAVYTSRVTARLEVEVLDYVNTWDAAAGAWDDRPGPWDGDPDQYDATSARLQIATTNGDPALPGATWSAWTDFAVGDVAARGLKFRAVLTSRIGTQAPLVRVLTVTVDMPDRIERQDDLTVNGTLAVTFPTAFKAVPALGVAVTMADGDRYVISGKTASGFTITIFTGSTQSTNAATLDYVAAGYGRQA